MSFRVPSSSPPSTPDRPHHSDLDEHPSTTPAGPPPTSLTGFSTTPAGNPPASSFLATGSNGSAVPFPSFSQSRQPPPSSSSRSREQPILEDEFDDDDAMEEDEMPGPDLMEYSQASLDDSIPTLDTLNLLEMAKGLATPTPSALKESDTVILHSEETLDHLSQKTDGDSFQEAQLLRSATQDLLDIWRQAYPSMYTDEGLGPDKKSPGPAKALFVASLAFQIHHASDSRHVALRHRADPMPKLLLGWLERHHWPFKSDFEEALNFKPNPASHERFWDILYNTALRGNLSDTTHLLRIADLSKAATALNDGALSMGYEGKQLANANRVLQRAITVLESCPAMQSGDWNVKGSEWMIFRRRVHQAMTDLQSFAEGNSTDRYSDGDSNFEASHFGMTASTTNGLSISHRSRQAESKVPWSIYQNLTYLYGQLLGTPSEITAASSDWVEASLGITAWWDGDDADMPKDDLRSSRRLSKSVQRKDRLVDTHPQAAYLRRLTEALLMVQNHHDDDSELQIDPTDAIEVALGCVIGNELEGLILLLRSWSPVIAAAVVEIADRGGWLGRPRPSKGIIDGFNQSDLMVLSYAPQRGVATDHDTILGDFADLLFKHPRLQSAKTDREGWQVAIEALGRLHDEDLAEKKIGALLDELDLGDTAEVDATVRLCNKIGLQSHARRISERYGDKLAETTHLYGAALFHYTRSGAIRKIKDLLNLLTSLSLAQSMAYPPANDLDESFHSLIDAPRQTMANLASLEPDLSASLLRHLSGYATIRRFFELRDQEYLEKSDSIPSMRPIARKKQALACLVSLIQSASDSIHGGLFDDSVDTAVPIDGLLNLLGEALPFTNHPKSLLTRAQAITILKAAEDLSTVSSTIFGPCEDSFKAAIASFHGSAPPSPRSTLKKSISNLSGSQFSLIGSELLKQSQSKSCSSNSGVLVEGPVKRGWDWRKGFERSAEGEDVLKILRLGLSKEMSRTWIRDA